MRIAIPLGLIMAVVVPLPEQELPDHSTFDGVLQKFLHNGLVDYAALQNDRTDLDAYIAELGRVDARRIAAAPRNARLAFWINAYNACALRLVIDHYPIQRRGLVAGLANSVAGVPANSIRQIPNTWKRKFCPVAGSERALDEIEHDILRPMGEPRVHFAVNCASRSCPELAPRAYTVDSVAAQLDAAVRRFVADPQHYLLEREPRVLHLNQVLDWYKEDFGGESGVVRFLERYVPAADAELLRSPEGIAVRYLDYDWTLNDTAVFATG